MILMIAIDIFDDYDVYMYNEGILLTARIANFFVKIT